MTGNCHECPLMIQCSNVYSRVAERSVIVGESGPPTRDFGTTLERRQVVLDKVANVAGEIAVSTMSCDGPRWGRVSSWLISRAVEPEGAALIRLQFAKCSVDDMYRLHRALRVASADF